MKIDDRNEKLNGREFRMQELGWNRSFLSPIIASLIIAEAVLVWRPQQFGVLATKILMHP